MKKGVKIFILILTALMFILLDTAFYFLVTYRCVSEYSVTSLDIERYMPFRDDSLIVKYNGQKLSGDLPRVDGAAALFPLYSAYVNAWYPEDSFCYENGEFSKDSAMQYRNTVRAYKAIVDGDADIIFCAVPSEEQLEYADQKGVELKFTPIGREAFVFIVNKNNPVDSLTAEQIRGIYTGKYTNWKEVGGINRPILPTTRYPGSGSQSRMDEFMGDERIKPQPTGITGAAIGFSFRYYVTGILKNDGVKLLAVDGAYPDAEKVESGAYPLVSEFYAVTRADNTNPNVDKLIEFILSEEGQNITEQTGYFKIKAR